MSYDGHIIVHLSVRCRMSNLILRLCPRNGLKQYLAVVATLKFIDYNVAMTFILIIIIIIIDRISCGRDRYF